MSDFILVLLSVAVGALIAAPLAYALGRRSMSDEIASDLENALRKSYGGTK